MNGKSTWKYNKLLTARRNYFDYGSGIEHATTEGAKEGTKGGNFFNGVINSLNPANINWTDIGANAINAVGNVGYGLLSGGKSSTAGSIFKTLGDITGSPALQVFAGGVNALFGSNLNTENIAKVEANIDNLNSFKSNASNFDNLAQNWANADVGMTFSNSFIGKDGLFSNKAKNKANNLRKQIEAGNTWVNNTLVNNAENIGISQVQNLLGNYAALGGQLSYKKNTKPSNVDTITQFKNIIRNNAGPIKEVIPEENLVIKKIRSLSQDAQERYNEFKGKLYDDGGPIFNPFTKKWTRNGEKIGKRYNKSWGYVEYTDDGFAVNYNKQGREIGRKKGTRTPYISGKGRNEQEQNYFAKDPEYTDSVKVIAARYGLNPNLVASRLAREGMDIFIRNYNESGGKELISNSNDEAAVSGMLWGLDNIYSNIADGSTKILEPWVNITDDFTFKNEKGQEVHSGYFNKWSDIISATAAELRARRDRIAKKYKGLSEDQLDAAASASFNMGDSKVKKAIENGTISKYKPFITL